MSGSETQTAEETKTVGAGVIRERLLPAGAGAGAGEHNFRIKAGRRRKGETKRIRPRMILLPPRPLIEADLSRVRDDNNETFAPISIVFVSVAEPGLRVGQSERRARLASDSRMIILSFFCLFRKV